MISASKHDGLFEMLANSCILAGIGLLMLDALPMTQFILPMNELSEPDFLIAAGLIPHLSGGMAALVNMVIG